MKRLLCSLSILKTCLLIFRTKSATHLVYTQPYYAQKITNTILSSKCILSKYKYMYIYVCVYVQIWPRVYVY